jgi:hypothetical protein
MWECADPQGERPSISIKIWGQSATASVSMNDNHPVLNALEGQLEELRRQYVSQPNEHTRYQLVRLEQLIRQWAPSHTAGASA